MRRPKLNNSFYFITASTFLHSPYFNTDTKKEIILDQFKKVQEKFNCYFYGFSIVPDHYHCSVYLKFGSDLPKIFQVINGGGSFLLNKKELVNQKVWENCWSEIVLNKTVFYKVLGYTIGNPLKHGIVKNFHELKNYRFSSYNNTASKYGDKFTENLVRNVINLNLEKQEEFRNFSSSLKLTKVR